MTDAQQHVIDATIEFLQKEFANEGTGHDWWHLERVWVLAKRLGSEEAADPFVTELAALLHDIGDHKFHAEGTAERRIREWLGAQKVEPATIDRVVEIVEGVSFKGAGVPTPMASIEGKVVQDADRLDALGAIGIARAFAYGGSQNRAMYVPGEQVVEHQNFESYRKTQSSTINHFHEKLLLLKDRLHTEAAKRLAEHRHKYMEKFLEEFHAEWEGKR